MNTNDQELILDYLHGREQINALRLNELLREDANARAFLRLASAAEVRLRELSLVEGMDRPARKTNVFASWRRPLAAAAAVVLGMAAVWWSQRGIEVQVVQASSSVSGEWRDGDNVRLDHVTLASGNVQMRLASGVMLGVTGPSEVKLMDAMHVRLLSGRVTAAVPGSAHGFAVETPAGRVVDLGTRFGVETGTADAVEVHVFEGKVELVTKQNQLVQLAAGDAAVFDPLRGVAAKMRANAPRNTSSRCRTS